MSKITLTVACSTLFWVGSCSDNTKSEESTTTAPALRKTEPDKQTQVAKKAEPEEPVQPRPELPPIEQGVVLEIEPHTDPDGRRFIIGETNLPEDTPVQIEVAGLHWFGGEDDKPVKNGRIRAALEGIPEGHYVATAMVYASDAQILAERLSKPLHGQSVKKDEDGVRVESQKSFFVGETREAAKAADDAFKARIRQYYEQLVALYETGEETMGKLRRVGTNEAKRKCIEMLVEKKAIIKNIRDELEHLPLPVPSISELRGAASHLLGCVTCSDEYATRSCGFAKRELDQAKKAIRKL